MSYRFCVCPFLAALLRDFFFKTAVKSSNAPLRITSRCESFCSCEFKSCVEFHADFAFVVIFGRPAERFFLIEQ